MPPPPVPRASRRACSPRPSRASCPGWRWGWRSSRWASPAISRGRASRPPPAPVVMAPPTTAPPPTTLATPAPPPVTAAPAPDFGEAGGKAAASVKARAGGLRGGQLRQGGRLGAGGAARGRRERAGEEDPGAGDGRAEGRRPGARGDAALARGDFAAAEAAAAEALPDRAVGQGRGGAPAPDRRGQGAGPARRRRQGRERAHRAGERGAQRGRDARCRPSSTRPRSPPTTARSRSTPATRPRRTAGRRDQRQGAWPTPQASGPRAGAGPVKSFVPGRTEAKARRAGGLVGFDETRRASTSRRARRPPGCPARSCSRRRPRCRSRARPSRSWSSSRTRASQPIPLAPMMSVSTTVDGKPQKGQLAPATATVAPGQRGLVFQTPSGQVWKDSTQSWVMEIVVTTQRNETLPQYAHLEVAPRPFAKIRSSEGLMRKLLAPALVLTAAGCSPRRTIRRRSTTRPPSAPSPTSRSRSAPRSATTATSRSRASTSGARARTTTRSCR